MRGSGGGTEGSVLWSRNHTEERKEKGQVKRPGSPHANKQPGGDFRAPKVGSPSRLRGVQALRCINTQLPAKEGTGWTDRLATGLGAQLHGW